MSGIISQRSIVPTWTPAYCSAKTAGNGATLRFCAGFKEPDVSNAMACTSQNTIRNLVGAARPTTKSTHHDLRQKKGNPAPTCSSARTIAATILPTLINTHFGTTGSTESGIRKNTLRSMKIGLNHSILKQTMLYANDCWKSQDFFTKHLQELPTSQHSPQNINTFQYYPNSRTSLVQNLQNPQLFELQRRSTHGL